MHDAVDLYLAEYKGELVVLDTRDLHPLRIKNLVHMKRIKPVRVIVANKEEGVGIGA